LWDAGGGGAEVGCSTKEQNVLRSWVPIPPAIPGEKYEKRPVKAHAQK